MLVELESFLRSDEVRGRVFQRASRLKNDFAKHSGLVFLGPLYRYLGDLCNAVQVAFNSAAGSSAAGRSALASAAVVPIWNLLCAVYLHYQANCTQSLDLVPPGLQWSNRSS